MDQKEIKTTPVWGLYEKGRDYARMIGMYEDTDKNNRFYNGNQWEGCNLGGIEPIQENFIRPVVKYKCAVIHSNLYGIVYDSTNFEEDFQPIAERFCGLINKHMARVWERDKLDVKLRRITKHAAINDEGIMYIRWDVEGKVPKHEVLKKNDVYYGDENNDNIEEQPYILIRKRLSESEAIELALEEGLPEGKTKQIAPDQDTFDQSGDAAKYEVDDKVTIIYKLYKSGGTVKYDVATRLVTIAEGKDTQLTRYPLAHFIWEEKEGSARGEGEVRNLIPNQIEVNRLAMRRALTAKTSAHPLKVVDTDKIQNADALDRVGSTIKTKGKTVDDVRKVVGFVQPAAMSPDAKMLEDDLIVKSRELAGAGDVATGQADPGSASGRAVLATQSASREPVAEHTEAFKGFVEDIGRIDMEMFIVYAADGMDVPEETEDPYTGQKIVRLVNIPQAALQRLKLDVKIEITPKGVYDKYSQEQFLESLLTQGLLNPQRSTELRIYAELLDDDANAPKRKILEAVEKIEKEKEKIARINAQAQMHMQSAQQFLSQDPATQGQQLEEAQQQEATRQMLRERMAQKMAEKSK